jgi:hypothetical protein
MTKNRDPAIRLKTVAKIPGPVPAKRPLIKIAIEKGNKGDRFVNHGSKIPRIPAARQTAAKASA